MSTERSHNIHYQHTLVILKCQSVPICSRRWETIIFSETLKKHVNFSWPFLMSLTELGIHFQWWMIWSMHSSLGGVNTNMSLSDTPWSSWKAYTFPPSFYLPFLVLSLSPLCLHMGDSSQYPGSYQGICQWEEQEIQFSSFKTPSNFPLHYWLHRLCSYFPSSLWTKDGHATWL